MRKLLLLNFLFLSACGESFHSNQELEDSFIVEDVIYDKASFAAIANLDETDNVETMAMAAKHSHVELWQDGVLPIQFDPTVTHLNRQIFFEVCKAWGEESSVVCIPRGNQSNYVYVTDDSRGCFADLGRGSNGSNYRRILNLGSGSCWQTRTILHEIGHILGLMHEHQRPDRDKYIKVNYNNIAESCKPWYKPFANAGLKSEFDINSIMMYYSTACSSNGQYTLTKLDGSKVSMVGSLSKLDVSHMGKLYPKKSNSSRTPASVDNPPRNRGKCLNSSSNRRYFSCNP